MKIVATNLPNPFDLVHFLPLMEDAKRAQTFENSMGVHGIIIPSNLGGRLTVSFGKKHRTSDHVLVVADTEGKLHRQEANGKVYIDIAPGKRGKTGLCLANVLAPTGRYSIYALFEELGFAREKDGSPLIPWNFWYWPYGNVMKEKTAWGSNVMFPLSHYEKAFKVKGVRAWEKEHHNDPAGTRQSWEGHCHNAAPASILFQAPPDAGLEFNGVRFSCEELKFYATEFFGRFGNLGEAWRLPGEGTWGRTGKLQEQRPSDDPELFGTDDGALTGLLNTLRLKIRDEGHALLMDLRDSTGLSHAEVWNQAVYQYVTRYWQTDPTDLQLTEGLTMILANDDFLEEDGSSSGLPAESDMIDGQRVAAPNGSGRIQKSRFRIRFTSTGEFDAVASHNRWWNVQRGDTKIHAPRFAYFVEKPVSTERPGSDGNSRIERSHVMSLLSLRERYS